MRPKHIWKGPQSPQGQHGGRHGLGIGTVGGEILDPADRADQLEDLVKAGHDPDDEDQDDDAVQPGIGGKDRQDRWQGQEGTDPGQAQHDQHEGNLPHGL